MKTGGETRLSGCIHGWFKNQAKAGVCDKMSGQKRGYLRPGHEARLRRAVGTSGLAQELPHEGIQAVDAEGFRHDG